MDMFTLAMAKAYTDQKAGYVEPGKEVFSAELTEGVAMVIGGSQFLESGKTYIVRLDSGVYTAGCVEIGEGMLGLGNMALSGQTGVPDTGESYFVYNMRNDGDIWDTAVIDANGGGHVSVELTETIHTIDPKYLPGVCLPMVEITSAEYPAEGDMVELSAEESAQLQAAAESGIPLVVKVALGGFPMSVVCNSLAGQTLGGYMCGLNVVFALGETGWVMGGG